MIAPLDITLHYLAMGLSDIALTFIIMRGEFPLRQRPALFWAYFLVKTYVDCQLIYAASIGLGAWVDGARLAWTTFTGFASFVVFYLTFRGDFLTVGACALAFDFVALVLASSSLAIANVLFDIPSSLSHLQPFGTYSLVRMAMLFTFFFALLTALSRIPRFVHQFMMRHRSAYFLVGICLIGIMANQTQNLISHAYDESFVDYVMYVGCGSIVVLALSLLLWSRSIRQRERLLAECVSLVKAYDKVARDQLEQLELDRAALEGHERVLAALQQQGANDELVNHIKALKDTYRTLSTGTYCEHPALDAVLVSGAARLRSLGARPTITVAGISTQQTAPIAVVLMMINLACEAAERTKSTRNSDVDLRIRSVDGQLLLHLEVPAQWGSIWARRYLSVFDECQAGLVSERKRGDRRVVLALCERS